MVDAVRGDFDLPIYAKYAKEALETIINVGEVTIAFLAISRHSFADPISGACRKMLAMVVEWNVFPECGGQLPGQYVDADSVKRLFRHTCEVGRHADADSLDYPGTINLAEY
jgi:hypothetical protein